MAVTLTGASGLFTILGKLFFAIDTLNTARGTTVPDEVVDFIDQFENLTNDLEIQEIVDGVESGALSWQVNDALVTSLVNTAERLIVKLVNDDNPLPDDRLRTALEELISQMEGAGGQSNPDDDVDASTAAVSVSVGSGNNSDGVVVASATLGNGRNAENALAEDIEATVSSTSGSGSIRLQGEQKERRSYSHRWPKGSGANRSLNGVTGGLLANGGFDDEDDRDNTPDDWIIETGTIGTTLKMTDYEVQTVIISGTPGDGTYSLVYTDVDSETQTTSPLAYNASGAAVQAALRELTGLESVEVSTSGDSPDLTHTITFADMLPPGNIGNLSSTNTFDQGSIAHAQVTAGTAHVYKGKAVEFDGDGAEATAIKQRVDLSAETPYAFNCYMKVDSFPAAGVLTIDLIDGAGSVIADSQGTNNSFTVDPKSGGDLSTSAFTAVNGFFRLPTVVPDIVYLRIRASTAISNTSSVFIDEATLVAATQLYPAGPFAAFFAGTTDLGSDDTWTIVVTNDRAGEFQEHFFRAFGFTDLLLPSDSGGTETIADTLIA